jgi:hypothetical protein
MSSTAARPCLNAIFGVAFPGGGVAGKQVGAGSGGRDPELLPAPSLTPDRFEDFTETLLHRQRFIASPARRLIEISRWGRRGDKQDGIDFVGAYDDGTTVTWQCKRVDKMTPADVRTYISENSYTADEHVLVFSGLASPEARTEALKVQGWSLLDQRDLGQLVHDLPLHRARTLLEQFWDPVVRRAFLPVAGIDAFLGLDEHFAPTLDRAAVLHHRAALVGRNDVLAALDAALDPTELAPRIVLIAGPGGRGKTRLALEALRHVEDAHPTIPVLVHQERRPLDSAALSELPGNPAVILTEDAHRAPDDLAPLLTYTKHTPGTKLLITARATGADEVRAALQRAGFDTGQILEVPIEPLTLGAARALVDTLAADGPALPAEFDEFLAAEGRDTPLIPVVAISMARAGRLATGPLALDQGIRDEILRAYADVTAGDVSGWPRPIVRGVLATVAAVAPLPSSGSDEFLDAAAAVAGVSRANFLEIVSALLERGVIVERGEQLRVAPDVLADEVLDSAAVVRGRDTGFVTRLWEALGQHAGLQLVVNLGALAGRLARTGGPDLFGRVWDDVEAEFDAAGLQQVDALARMLAPLAYTQPERLFTLLTRVLPRLPTFEQAARVAAENAVTDDAREEAVEDNGTSASTPQEAPRAALISYRGQLTAGDVARGCAPLLARCAQAAPALLGPALDILWDLAAVDGRQTNQYPDHPARLICDDLVDLGRIAQGSLPVVLDRVETWLRVPDTLEAPRTPLFVLAPLLAKNGLRYAQRRQTLEFSPFFVPPDKVASARDRIRRLLVAQGSGADVRRAVEAAQLLGIAMDPPHGYFGHTVPPEVVLGWEDDDLAAVAALRQIAQATSEPLVRRTIRHKLEWDATRALSQKVRRAALELVTELDERVEDDLTEAILGRWVRLLISRRGIAVPDRAASDFGGDGGGPAGPDDLSDSATIVDEGTAERTRNRDAAVAALWREHSPAEVIEVLDERLRVIAAAHQSSEVQGMGELLAKLGASRPAAVPDLVTATIGLPEGPLDRFLHVLLDAWTRSGIDAFVAALPGLIAARPGVAGAVAYGFRVHRWVGLDPRLAQAHREAMPVADPQLRGQWLAGAGEMLRSDPVAAVPFIIDAAAGADWGVAEALEAASHYDPDGWSASLDEQQSLAVLALTRVCGWRKWGVQRIVSGIARAHPRAVLDALTGESAERLTVDEVDGLPAALASHGAVLSEWLRDLLLLAGQGDEWRIAGLLPVALGESLTGGAARAVADVVASAGADELLRLVRMLWHCDGFTLAHPDLVGLLLGQAETLLDEDGLEEAKRILVAAAVPSGGRWSSAATDETHVARRDRALQLARDMTLSVSARTIFSQAAATIQAVMDEDARQWRDGEG